MKAFIAGTLAAAILAVAAAVVLDGMLQSSSGVAFSADNVRLGDQ
ncbi:hypothetical protein ACFOW6_08400 [Fodinicurvata halophila]|uniref:Uncharacterized protein n=1 Tax=Fodinicurvata halophila TaxID=1419723 RepID=A0ABV8UL74_9PROT